jgi:hypothetical protein
MIAEILNPHIGFNSIWLHMKRSRPACKQTCNQDGIHLWDFRENFTMTQSYAFVSVSAKLKLTQKECAQS